jgi:hypothetical protein
MIASSLNAQFKGHADWAGGQLRSVGHGDLRASLRIGSAAPGIHASWRKPEIVG